MSTDPTDAGADDGAGDEAYDGPWEPRWWWRVAIAGVVGVFLGVAGTVFWQARDTPTRDSIDAGFYQDMVSHHEQAIQMALLELSNGADRTVLGFAREILVFQNQQIGQMREQLRIWGYATDQRSDTAMAWMGAAVPVESMPGMATEEEFKRLQTTTGRGADELFLELMANHHRGGVSMALYAARNAADGSVRDLAALMARVQVSEVAEYALVAKQKGLDVEIGPMPPVPSDLGR